MILFINVFITKNFATSYDRGHWGVHDRLDVFKYSLASMAVIPWTKVIIHCQLDEVFKDRRQELDDYIYSIFPNDRISNYHTRIDKQSKWKTAMHEVFAVEGDELVWFTCNDDHIFLDYDLDVLNACERRMNELIANGVQHVSTYFSHWPEMLCHASFDGVAEVLEQRREFFEVEWINIDSIQIVSKAVLRHWWFAHEYGDDVFLIRTDGNLCNLGPEYIHIHQDLRCRTLIPLREMARHFDGYCRPYMPGGSADINRCTPMFIPPGFFDAGGIKIAFCKEQRKDGYINVNPVLANYSTVDPAGADCKLMLEDLPLFWRNKIVDIDFGPEVDRQVLIAARNKAVQLVANSEKAFLAVSSPVPMEWLGVAYR